MTSEEQDLKIANNNYNYSPKLPLISIDVLSVVQFDEHNLSVPL